tara:strand:+ start:2056 stop:2793 length:738 start_codon:yes stop_codon:yes gene_type:complete
MARAKAVAVRKPKKFQLFKKKPQRKATSRSKTATFLNEAPLFKLVGVGVAIWGVNSLIDALVGDDSIFSSDPGRVDPLDTPIAGDSVANFFIFYDPNNGVWQEKSFIPFDDDKYFYQTGTNNFYSDIPPTTSNSPVPGKAKSITNFAGSLLPYFNDTFDFDADSTSNAVICEFMNLVLTVALKFTDAEVKAFFNSTLALTGSQQSFLETLKDSQAYMNNASQLPYSKAIFLLEQRLTQVGADNKT